MSRASIPLALAAAVLGLAVALLVAACGESSTTGLPSAPGSRGVTQAGAQDIARFRQIVGEGGVPAPETLDDVGFFAEHAVDLPPADCGQDLCVHPMLAVAPRFDRGNWTMAFVGLNTPVDPATLERPPVTLGVVVDRELAIRLQSGFEAGLTELSEALRDADRAVIAVYGASVATTPLLTPAELGASPTTVVNDLVLDAGLGGSELFAAVAEVGQRLAAEEGAHQLVIVTDGSVTGVMDTDRIVELCAGMAAEGTSVTVIGARDTVYRAELPLALAEIGAGNYYYAEDSADLAQILGVEGATTLFPLALGFELTLDAGSGYRIGRVYGATRVVRERDRVRLSAPALFIGHRTGADDVEQGRRGGGGGLFVELRAVPTVDELQAGLPAFRVAASWLDPVSRELSVSESEVVNPLRPGQNPDQDWPYFSDEARGKIYMMLNLYLTLAASVRFYDAGDCARAQGVVDMVGRTVPLFQERYADPDVDADYDLLLDLRQNLTDSCTVLTPIEPVGDFAGGCMLL